eukprot:ctg_949.g223
MVGQRGRPRAPVRPAGGGAVGQGRGGDHQSGCHPDAAQTADDAGSATLGRADARRSVAGASVRPPRPHPQGGCAAVRGATGTARVARGHRNSSTSRRWRWPSLLPHSGRNTTGIAVRRLAAHSAAARLSGLVRDRAPGTDPRPATGDGEIHDCCGRRAALGIRRGGAGGQAGGVTRTVDAASDRRLPAQTHLHAVLPQGHLAGAERVSHPERLAGPPDRTDHHPLSQRPQYQRGHGHTARSDRAQREECARAHRCGVGRRAGAAAEPGARRQTRRERPGRRHVCPEQHRQHRRHLHRPGDYGAAGGHRRHRAHPPAASVRRRGGRW